MDLKLNAPFVYFQKDFIFPGTLLGLLNQLKTCQATTDSHSEVQ